MAQADVIRKAYSKANLSPYKTSYIEVCELCFLGILSNLHFRRTVLALRLAILLKLKLSPPSLADKAKTVRQSI